MDGGPTSATRHIIIEYIHGKSFFGALGKSEYKSNNCSLAYFEIL
jgi:hypothetical protein